MYWQCNILSVNNLNSQSCSISIDTPYQGRSDALGKSCANLFWGPFVTALQALGFTVYESKFMNIDVLILEKLSTAYLHIYFLDQFI